MASPYFFPVPAALPLGPLPTKPSSGRRWSRAWLLIALVAGLGSGFGAERLKNEPSAFLRASADSPVEWQKWDAAVLQRAKAEGRPVYVFIGSFLSELSRATCRQTFANADTAAFLNKNFICVIVDRDEQPAVAALARYYLRNVKQVSTWPAHLWLTPELQPYEGSGYLPPTEEWGKASFMKFAQQVQSAWATDPAGCRTRAAEAVASLMAPELPAVAGPVLAERIKGQLAAAAEAWRASLDATHGGFGEAPKYPEPELLRFLLRGSPADRAAAQATLRALATSALRDPLDGGFFRYATDVAWRIPYQQKSVADQARLALAFLDAAQGDDEKAFTAAARGALDYALNRLGHADGTFAAAEDATGDEFAGYYAWTEAEIDAALGKDAAAFKQTHGVTAAGNITAEDDSSGRLKGRNLLHATASGEAEVTGSAARLLAVRSQRPAPIRDERATAGAHGLLLAALSRVGAQPGGKIYLDAATRTFEALKKQFGLGPDGEPRRFVAANETAAPADWTALALGCREYGRAARRPEVEALAASLLERAGQTYLDGKSGVYLAVAAGLPAGFFVRPPAGGDAPSAESLALQAGVPPARARALAAGLSATLDDSGPPPAGDALLALALFPSN